MCLCVCVYVCMQMQQAGPFVCQQDAPLSLTLNPKPTRDLRGHFPQ